MDADVQLLNPMPPACPLCAAPDATSFFRDAREYLRCETCALLFVHPAHLPDARAEAERYRLHHNDPRDPGYLKHLRQLADPLSARLRPGARGLDVGSGPTPALADILQSRGFPTVSCDPLFHADEALLRGSYDFVTCSEVMEHVHRPAELLDTIASLLRPAGVLGVMTRFADGVAFDTWWYRRDLTHVCFYSVKTIEWIAASRGWRLELPAPHVALFQLKPTD